MANLLYLVHRLPYPPNKGDKLRSYHLLKHLARRHRVFLGSFVDDPDDWQHLDTLRGLCAEVFALPLHPLRRRAASLGALATGQALTLRYYHDARLHQWVARTVAAQPIAASVVFSSSMAPYALRHPELPMLLDLVDVDSAKWTAYAEQRRGPMAWLYRREGQRLLAYERAAVAASAQSFLVTDNEVALFRGLAPEAEQRVTTSCNGVDAEFFAPQADRPSPFAEAELPLVFTGAMDYWPNVDAVVWFVEAVLPLLRRQWPAARLHIVGRNPTPAVRALAGDAVQVSGTVPDVRPYLQHAAVVVAPLRLARGVQNKVLEAMAMARPVVAAASCVSAIHAQDGRDILAAETATEHAAKITSLLAQPERARALGLAARACVLDQYSWTARLAGFDQCLGQLPGAADRRARQPLDQPEPA